MCGPRGLQLRCIFYPAVIFGVVPIDVSQVAVFGIAPLLAPDQEECPRVRYNGRSEYCLGEAVPCKCIYLKSIVTEAPARQSDFRAIY